MADQDRFLEALCDFARTLSGDCGLGDVLHDLSVHVTDVLATSGAGVAFSDHDGTFRFVTVLNEATSAIERLQEELQEGPCVDVHQSGKVVLVADLRQNPERWPNLAPRALELEILAVAGLPMQIDGGTWVR